MKGLPFATGAPNREQGWRSSISCRYVKSKDDIRHSRRQMSYNLQLFHAAKVLTFRQVTKKCSMMMNLRQQIKTETDNKIITISFIEYESISRK